VPHDHRLWLLLTQQRNPFKPHSGQFLTKILNSKTRQPIELEGCSNPLRIQQVF